MMRMGRPGFHSRRGLLLSGAGAAGSGQKDAVHLYRMGLGGNESSPDLFAGVLWLRRIMKYLVSQ